MIKDSYYWNEEDDENIICPYCGKTYEPSYEDTYIGDDSVDCYTSETETYTCEVCGKKFTMYGYQAGWKYVTETIDGECTEEEFEKQNNPDSKFVESIVLKKDFIERLKNGIKGADR